MSLEALRERIIQRAKEEANRIIEEAEKKAREIIEEARRRAREEKERLTREKIKEARREAQRIISEASFKARLKMAQVKEEALEEVFKEAYDKIKSRNFDVDASITSLLKEVLDIVKASEGLKLYVNEEDVERAKKAAKELGLKKFDVSTAPITGGVIVEAAEMRIDNSYDTRFTGMRTVLARDVARILFGEA